MAETPRLTQRQDEALMLLVDYSTKAWAHDPSTDGFISPLFHIMPKPEAKYLRGAMEALVKKGMAETTDVSGYPFWRPTEQGLEYARTMTVQAQRPN